MKRISAAALLALLSAFMALPATAQAEWGRIYLAGTPAAPPVAPPPEHRLILGAAPGADPVPAAGTVALSGSWWFSPSVGFDVFTYDLKTHAYSVGIIPGIGYGLKYKPASWTATEAIFALDLFVQAGLLDETNTVPGGKYFSIQAIPIVTFLDWVSVGFGPDALLGISTAPGELHWMFSFGLRKST